MAWHGAAPRMAVRAANARRADSRAPDRDAIAILRRSPSPEGLELNPEDVRSRGTPVEEERKQARGTEVGRAEAGPRSEESRVGKEYGRRLDLGGHRIIKKKKQKKKV